MVKKKQPKLRPVDVRGIVIDADESLPDPWRHVVLMASFLFFFLEAGTSKSFGLLLSPMVFQLDSNFATMGVIFALPWSVEYMSAVFVKPLVNRIDPIKISTAGGLMASIAITLSSFSRTIWTLGILFFFFGIGESMVLVPAIICLHRHYKQQFAFACSFALVGSLVGMLVLPVATEILMEAYGLYNALLMLGGFCLHMLPIGLVLKMPNEKSKQKSLSARKHLLESDEVGCKGIREFPLEKNMSKTSMHVERNIMENSGYDKLSACEAPDPENVIDDKDRESERGNMVRGGEYDHEELGMTERTESSTNSGKGSVDSNVYAKGSSQGTHRQMDWVSNLKTFIGEARFFLSFVLPCDFIGAFVLITWTIFVIPYAISIGINESRAVFVATMGGVGGLVARIVGTVVFHFHPTWVSGQYVTLCSLTSLMLFILPLRTSYMYTLGCSFLMGFGLFGSVCLVEALVSNVVSPEVFPTAVSITYLFKGVSGILTAYTSGSLFDLTGSFQIVFYILGILEALNVGIILLLIVIKKRSNARSNKDPE